MPALRRALPLVLSLASACSAAPAPPTSRAPPVSAAPAPIGPARWLLTDRLGVMFDEGTPGSVLPRREPAIIDGVRVVVDGGLVVASARHADRLSGFRSIPARLGGGFVLWSEDRVYRAPGFLDDPTPIADVGATGGARPWLSTVILRTPSGLLELDPANLSLRRAMAPGVVDVFALDADRGVRVDLFGRASYTIDGGKSFTDVVATRGLRVDWLRFVEGEILLGPEAPRGLALGPRGDLHPTVEADRVPTGEVRTAAPTIDGALPATSRTLPGEFVAHAVAWGAPLPGGRVLVTLAAGVRVLASETGRAVADTEIPSIDERFKGCQAVAIGAPPQPALACSAAEGAYVAVFGGSLGRPELDAAFPQEDGGFIGGPRGRLAFDGRCGSPEPRATDLGPGTPKPGMEESTPPAPPDPTPAPEIPPEPPAADDARVCVRTAAAHWLPRRLRGTDARRLYRWVPGDDGAVTALVLAGKEEREADPPGEATSVPEGVRVIRVDPDDPALGGGAFPAVAPPQREAPFRMVDVDFWQDDEGAIRGWIRLPAKADGEGEGDGEEKIEVPASPQGKAGRMLRVATDRGGRSAGVRIDGAGKVTVFALPEGATQVVTGGPFALATAPRESGAAWFESLDGGAHWTPIEAPPVGRLELPPDEHAPFTCSPLGCAFGNGIVRLGWGSPAPAPPTELSLTPAVSAKPRDPGLPTLRCQLDVTAPPWAGSTPKGGAAKIGATKAGATKAGATKAGATKADAPKAGSKAGAAKAGGSKATESKAGPASKGAASRAASARAGAAGKAKARKGAGTERPHPVQPAAPGGPIALGLRAPFGELREHTWIGDVIPPFQPTAAVRHFSVTDRTLDTNQGVAIPMLTDRARDPLDLLILVDGRRLRATGATSLLPFHVATRLGAAMELGDGAIALLDTDRKHVFLARGAAVSAVVALSPLREVARTRLTLARKLGGGPALVGYSETSGEVMGGDLDLGRADVGPLTALARLSTLAACSGEKAAFRFPAELRLTVKVTGRGGEAMVDQQLTVALLIAASSAQLCVEAVEVVLPEGSATVLSATMGKGAVASVRSGGKTARGTCGLGR